MSTIDEILAAPPEASGSIDEILGTKAPTKTGFVRSQADRALSLGQGVVGGIKSIVDTAGTGTKASKALGGIADGIEGLYSPARVAEKQARQETIDKADSSGSTFDQVTSRLGGFAEAPVQTLAQGIGSMAPTVAAAVLTRGRSLAAPLALGTAMGVGGVKGQNFDAVQAEAIKHGLSPEKADELAGKASEYSRQNAPQQILGGALGALDAGTGVERLMGNLVHGIGTAAKGVVRRAVAGAAEEAIPEGLQGSQGQYAQNEAMNRAGFPTDPMAGVLGAGVHDAAVGGVLGAGASIPQRRAAAKAAREAEAAGQAAPVSPTEPPVSPTSMSAAVAPAPMPGDPIRATKLPEGGPLAKTVNIGVEQEAQSVDTGAPTAAPIASALHAVGVQESPAEASSALPPSPKNSSTAETNYPARPADGDQVPVVEPNPATAAAPSNAIAPRETSAAQAIERMRTVLQLRRELSQATAAGDTASAQALTEQIAAARAAAAAPVDGRPISKEWTAFAPESGAKGVPRASMPQIQAGHRGALTNFLNARGIAHESVEMPATDLKPTQAEFSPGKVEKAKAFTGTDRSILVSSDNHVLDGHHQWLAKRDAGLPINVIRLNAPIDKLLAEVKEFPSATQADGATVAAPAAEPAPTPAPKSLKERRAKAKSSVDDKIKELATLSSVSKADVKKRYDEVAAKDGVERANTMLDTSIKNRDPAPAAARKALTDSLGAEEVARRLEQLERRANRAGYTPLTEDEFKPLVAAGYATGTKWSTGKLTSEGRDELREMKREAEYRNSALAGAKDLIGEGLPFKASAVDEYSMAVPEGYKRESSQFVKAKPAAEAKTETVATPSEKPAGKASEPAMAGKVEDFGEKLEGARKFAAPSLRAELSDDDLATQPLSKVWPADEAAGIEDNFTAAVATAARAEVPPKPRTAYKVARWVEKVKVVRQLAQFIVSGKITKEQFADKMAAIRGLDGFAAKVDLMTNIDRAQWGRIGSVNEYPEAYRYQDGKRVLASNVRVEIDGKSHMFEDAAHVANVLDRVNALLGVEAKPTPMQFEVRGSGNSYNINKKGDKEYRKLKTFTTAKEALDYVRSDNAALVAAWDEVKARDNVRESDVRGDSNRPRTAEDYRKGKDVTAEQFDAAFGFRGVQFGNWVEQGSEKKGRQAMLNQAYDALMDLANIVGVPPRAISLNGTMGLAFGARGKGNFAAHFEPGNLVINLTKTHGAGTLAHEWFHALDNYFARARGGEVKMTSGMTQADYRKSNYITYKPEALYVRKDGRGTPMSALRLRTIRTQNPGSYYAAENWHVDPKHPEGVRPAIEERFAELVKALDASPMLKRAEMNDKGADGYWSRIIERGARSFENYIISKMMEKGYHNDYLANVKAVEDFSRSKERYPYLLPEEVKPIAEAFDALFSTVETKAGDNGNVAMFSRTKSPESLAAQRIERTQNLVQSITSKWANSPSVTVLVDMADPRVPESVRNADATQKSQGAEGEPAAFITGGKIYLVASQLKTDRQVIEALHHESLGHAGLRGVFGQALNPILDSMGRLNAAQVRAKAKEYGLDFDKPGERRHAAEEVLAELASTDPRNGWVKQAVAAIRTWLRENVPGFREMKYSDAELVRSYLAPARGWIERSRFADTEPMVRENADLRFSRTDPNEPAKGYEKLPAVDRVVNQVNRTGQAIKSMTVTDIKEHAQKAGNKLADYRGIGLQMLGRRQLVDLYAKDIPAMAHYSELVQQMDADKNETGAEADGLATAWGKLPDERQLAELMHDATLAQIDPSKEMVAGDNSLQYRRLNAQYNALSPEAQKMYLKARDMYVAHYQKVQDEIRQRIERAMPVSERRAEMLQRMDAEFFGKTKGVYFPLSRFGDYVVVAKDGDRVVSVARAETLNEANATRRGMLAQFADQPTVKVGKVLKSKEFNSSRDMVSKGFIKELFDTLEGQNVPDDVYDSINQLYLESLPDLSWAKHGIHRKGTPGFSQDARRAFAQHMFHGARYLAKLRYSDQLNNGLDAMQKQVSAKAEDANYDSIRAQQVVDEMVKRHDSLMNPKSNPLSTALTSFGFVFHLGLSPASAIANLSQTALVAYPIMAAKWGYGRASAALLKASKQTAANKNDISKVLTGDEKRAYVEAVSAGVIDVTQAHDLAGISQGEDSKVAWKIRPVMRAASFLFHHAEKFNRQVTFVAAYRLARETGAVHALAYEQAVKATYDGHFDYGASNRPRLMQGNAAKVLLLFRQFGQNMIYTLARQAQLSLKGETPEVRKEARKALAGLLAMHAAGAGVLGLPLVTTLLSAASMISGSDDEPWDAEVALRNMLADTFGQKAGEVMAHGLSHLTPWDLSGRVGLNSMILPDLQEGLQGQRLGESAMAASLGPVAGIGINLLKGLQSISEGHMALGIETMLPAALRGPMRAYRYATEGAIDKTGVPIKEEVGAAGVVGQALGLSPNEVREASEARRAIYSADKRLMERRKSLMNQFAQASMVGDQEGKAEALKDIAAYNQLNPERGINGQQLGQSVKNRIKRINESESGVSLPARRRNALEAGRFAAVED